MKGHFIFCFSYLSSLTGYNHLEIREKPKKDSELLKSRNWHVCAKCFSKKHALQCLKRPPCHFIQMLANTSQCMHPNQRN